GCLPFQVVAGAERLVAGAGHDRDPLVGIGGEIVKDLVELEMSIDMQRVVHFRPRQRHDRDRALARDLGKLQLHWSSREFFCGAEWPILAVARRFVPSNYASRGRTTSRSRSRPSPQR